MSMVEFDVTRWNNVGNESILRHTQDICEILRDRHVSVIEITLFSLEQSCKHGDALSPFLFSGRTYVPKASPRSSNIQIPPGFAHQ